MGHGPRGLQRGRQRLGLLHARPVPLARLPLGRGRPRRDLGRQAAPLLRARALERARPDPQGAALRPHEQRGEPRRGRQGVLLLPRLDADALVHEVPLQVPAAGVPVPRPRRDEPPAGRARSPSTSCSTPASSTTTATSTSFVEYAKAGPEDLLVRDHRPQPRARGRPAPPPADAVVPQHLVVGRRPRPKPSARRSRGPGADPRVAPRAGRVRAGVRRRAGAPLHREREQRRAPLGPAEPVALGQGRVPRVRRRRRHGRGEPGQDGHQGRGPLRPRRARRRLIGSSACGSRPPLPAPAVRQGVRRDRSPPASPTPTSSTSGSRRPR